MARRTRQELKLNKIVPITSKFSNYFNEDDQKSVSVERAERGNIRVITYDHSEGFRTIFNIVEFHGDERKFAESWLNRNQGILVSLTDF